MTGSALRHLQLHEWNDAPGAGTSAPSVVEQVERQVLERPNAVAVASARESATYGRLWARAGRLAHRLGDLGAAPERVVGVLLDRSPALVVAELAILRTGAAFLPLDAASPPERTRHALRDAGAVALVTRPELARRLGPVSIQVVGIDDPRDETAFVPRTSSEDPPPASPANLAYLIYTSGSTGLPKGVAVSRDSLLHLVTWHLAEYGVGPGDRAALVASSGFDASVWEIWPNLAAGATLGIPDESLRTDPAALVRWLTAERIELCFLPTPLAEAVLALTPPPEGSLRTLLTGGDRLHAPPPEGWTARIVNHYGPTEVTVLATREPVPAGGDGEPPPIGRPISATRVLVLDRRLELLPLGAAGEIWIAGRGLARGYHARPGLTAERFVPDPFAREAGRRMYRSGDLGRLLPDGRLAFLGRADRQIKVRGYRVEPGEIEALLLRQPSVREAAVVARADGPGDPVLVAFLAVAPGGEPDPEGLGAVVRAHLPEAMVPRSFVVLPGGLPKTASGKVDRGRLAALWPTGAALCLYRPPSSPAERVLAGIFAEELGVDRVGVDDDLLDLGGHSLLLGRALARAGAELGGEVSLRDALSRPTVAGIARLLARSRAAEEERPPAGPAPRQDETPLSLQQAQVWYIQRLHPESRAYHFQSRLRMRGRLQPVALARALDEIVRRHEIYRITFPARTGRPRQVIHPPSPACLEVVDLSGLADEALEGEVRRLERRELRRPFQLDALPLARWYLMRLSRRDHTLLHVEHHLVHDGWSFNLLLEEFLALYRNRRDGLAAALPAPAVRFGDFCRWQRSWIESPAAARQLEFWAAKLAGAPDRLSLPTDRPRPPVETYRGAVERFELPAGLGRELAAACRERRTTQFTFLFAVFTALLHRWTGLQDLVIGSAVANRRRHEWARVLGMFVNTLAVRVRWEIFDPPFSDHLRRVGEEVLDAFEHQELPLEKIVDALKPARSAAHSPFYQVTFSFHDSPLPELSAPGLDLELTEGLGNGSAKFDLNVAVLPSMPGRGRSEVVWEYASDLFDRTTVLRMTHHFQALLGGAIASPERPLSSLPLMAPGERWQLLGELNDTARRHSSAAPVYRRVVHRSLSRPDAVAAVDPEGHLSYGELARRSAAWARRLLAAGLEPEERVVVCASRSCAWAVAILAVVRAGGAYVPLDPGHPARRLERMVLDSGCRWLLTDRKTRRKVAGVRARSWVVDEPVPAGVVEALQRDGPEADGESLAYGVYTSGSTGEPKSVLVAHGALANLVDWHREAYRVRPEDRVSQVASAAFDASVWEIWPALCEGAAAVFPASGIRSSPRELAAWFERERISSAFLPTPVVGALLQEPTLRELPLRVLLTGGDRLHAGPAEPLPFPLVNHYGPTENAVVATASAVPPGRRSAPPIGGPIAGVAVYLTDRRLRPVPLGVPGELSIAGASLARGYDHTPALTAERFVPRPWGGEAGGRLYRTGDLARRRPDGEIEFLGRLDHQVKVRGFRIELAEIEALLQRHPGVAASVAGLRDGEGGQPVLTAWWVPRAEGPVPTERALRDHLRAELPEPMVPSRLVRLRELPLTSNGKVDRGALRLPARQAATTPSSFHGPELRLAELWRELLGVESFGPEENFFDLGGHSLLLAEMQQRVADRFGLEIPLVELLAHPTVRDLARLVADSAPSGGAPPQAPAPPDQSGARNRLAALRRRRAPAPDEVGR
jgi:amino acid adenylation domain-containing protein